MRISMARLILSFLILPLSATLSTSAQAQPLQETWVTPVGPMAHEIEGWKKMKAGAENRSYLVQLGDPSSFELQQLLSFDLQDRVRLSATRIPSEDVREMYTKLASRGVEFISLEGNLPTDDEVNRLKKIGFSSSVFALTGAPSAHQAQLLHALTGKVSVSLVLKQYPKHTERAQYLAFPIATSLLFIMDFWPGYIQMDVLNMIPHVKRLRVRDIYPPQDLLPYINAIKNLEEISFELQSLPELDTWRTIVHSFPGKNLQWITHMAPSKEHLDIFIQSAQGDAKRRVTVDSDFELSAASKSALEAASIPADWIRATPFPSLRSRAILP